MVTNHLDHFIQFCELETSTGGPDPYLKLAAYAMSQIEDPIEKAWVAAAFCCPYDICTGSIIWSTWPHSRVTQDPEGFRQWVRETWPRWQIGRERRCARTPDKMFQSLISCASWIDVELSFLENAPYEDLWASANAEIHHFGRYIVIKFLEILWAGGVIYSRIPDIRAKDAWSPRTTLGWLWPEQKDICDGKNTKLEIDTINDLVEKTKSLFYARTGKSLSNFEIEVLLCNYRQMINPKTKKYPGWSQDRNLEQYDIAVGFWGPLEFKFLEARQELFPPLVLGEVQGWRKPRVELYYKDYFWCDTVYDYHKTTDLQNPVRRVNVSTNQVLPEGTYEYNGVLIRGYPDEIVYREQNSYRKLRIEEGDVVLDVGAHIGLSARNFLERGAGEVFAYEPVESNYKILVENAKGHNIHPIQRAIVGDNSQTIVIYSPRSPFSSRHSILSSRGTIPNEYEAENLLDVIQRVGPNVLKIDCEGAELTFIECLKQVHHYVSSIVIEIHCFQEGDEAKARELYRILNQHYDVIKPMPEKSFERCTCIWELRDE